MLHFIPPEGRCVAKDPSNQTPRSVRLTMCMVLHGVRLGTQVVVNLGRQRAKEATAGSNIQAGVTSCELAGMLRWR